MADGSHKGRRHEGNGDVDPALGRVTLRSGFQTVCGHLSISSHQDELLSSSVARGDKTDTVSSRGASSSVG